ncbi:MAG: hypothetical protein IKH75_00985 [Ruminococcus sp.]|nr:hypothetical protein [Ruminococcus sp.]
MNISKRDLRTGMTCVLRSGDKYIVMLDTGFGGRMENVLWKPNLFQSTFGQYLSLDDYYDDLAFRTAGDDGDWMFDVSEVYKHSGPVNIGNVNGFDAERVFKGE